MKVENLALRTLAPAKPPPPRETQVQPPPKPPEKAPEPNKGQKIDTQA